MTGPATETPTPDSTRRTLWIASMAASAATAGLLWTTTGGWLPFVTWLASIGCAVAVIGSLRTGPRLNRSDRGLLVALVVLAGGFRLWRIMTVPNGLWIDELATAVNAAHLAHAPFSPFGSTPLFADGPQWVHTSNLYLYACLILLKLTGFSQLGVKSLSVLPGIAAPPLLFLLARRFLPRPAALAAAGLLAVSSWHVTVSRWGWDEVLVTSLAIALFAKLLDGTDRGSAAGLYLAGALAGVAQYTYVAARLTALAAVGFIAVRVVTKGGRPLARRSALFLAGLIQVVLPLLVRSTQVPQYLDVRAAEVSILPRLRHGDLGPLVDNLGAYSGMFHFRGDPNPRQNLPGKPMLDPLVGVLFAAGLLIAVFHLRWPEMQLCLCWLGFGLLGGILSVSSATPNSYRVGQVEPACLLLAAVAIGSAIKWMEPRFRTGAHLGWWLALAPVVLSAILTGVDYFSVRPTSKECWEGLEDGAYAEVLRQRTGLVRAAGGSVILDPALRTPAAALLFDGLLPAREGRPVARWLAADHLSVIDLRHSVAFIPVHAWRRLPPALRVLPAVGLTDPFNRTFAVASSADHRLLSAIRAAGRDS
ncbi:MAG: glycosyltransferase family 39 protein [Acidobacteriota bacterium]